MFGGDTRDDGMQVAFEFPGAAHAGNAVGQSEQKPTQEGDHRESLRLDQSGVEWRVSALKLRDGLFADRDKAVHQILKNGGQLGIALRHHHQLEPSARTRSLRFHRCSHSLFGQSRQQRRFLIAVGRLGRGHGGFEIGNVLRNHAIGYRPEQIRTGVKVKRRRSVGDAGASIDPQMS